MTDWRNDGAYGGDRRCEGRPGPAPRASAATENLDVRRARFPQQVDDVFEELDVAALVAADCDALRVLLQSSVHDLPRRAVMPQVDHLGSARL